MLAFANARRAGSRRIFLLAMAFVVGTGRAFEQPSLQSVLPNIVPAELLPRAIAGSTSASQTAVVAGPALGGLLVAFSPTLVFAVCAAALAFRRIRHARHRHGTDRRRSARRSISNRCSAASSFIVRHKVVLGAVLLDLFAVLLGNATALLPIFARDIFASGPLGFGTVARGARRRRHRHGADPDALADLRPASAASCSRRSTIFGVGTILLALAPNFVLALAALVVVGAADTISVVIRQTMVQLRTPDEMRGRVYAVNSMVTITSNQLGDFPRRHGGRRVRHRPLGADRRLAAPS